MTDEVEVRCGIGDGVLFVLTAVVVAGSACPVRTASALLLVATGLLAAELDATDALLARPDRLGLRHRLRRQHAG